MCIHSLYLPGIFMVDDRAAYLQRIGKLAALHGKLLGKQREFLHFLLTCKSFLQLFDTLLNHALYLVVVHQVDHTLILYMAFPGIFF